MAMQDENDNRTGDLLSSIAQPTANARHQAAFRARQKAAGKRQMVVWINPGDWRKGFEAGDTDVPATPVPPDTDALSWFGGWIDGTANRKKRLGC